MSERPLNNSNPEDDELEAWRNSLQHSIESHDSDSAGRPRGIFQGGKHRFGEKSKALGQDFTEPVAVRAKGVVEDGEDDEELAAWRASLEGKFGPLGNTQKEETATDTTPREKPAVQSPGKSTKKKQGNHIFGLCFFVLVVLALGAVVWCPRLKTSFLGQGKVDENPKVGKSISPPKNVQSSEPKDVSALRQESVKLHNAVMADLPEGCAVFETHWKRHKANFEIGEKAFREGDSKEAQSRFEKANEEAQWILDSIPLWRQASAGLKGLDDEIQKERFQAGKSLPVRWKAVKEERDAIAREIEQGEFHSALKKCASLHAEIDEVYQQARKKLISEILSQAEREAARGGWQEVGKILETLWPLDSENPRGRELLHEIDLHLQSNLKVNVLLNGESIEVPIQLTVGEKIPRQIHSGEIVMDLPKGKEIVLDVSYFDTKLYAQEVLTVTWQGVHEVTLELKDVFEVLLRKAQEAKDAKQWKKLEEIVENGKNRLRGISASDFPDGFEESIRGFERTAALEQSSNVNFLPYYKDKIVKVEIQDGDGNRVSVDEEGVIRNLGKGRWAKFTLRGDTPEGILGGTWEGYVDWDGVKEIQVPLQSLESIYTAKVRHALEKKQWAQVVKNVEKLRELPAVSENACEKELSEAELHIYPHLLVVPTIKGKKVTANIRVKKTQKGLQDTTKPLRIAPEQQGQQIELIVDLLKGSKYYSAEISLSCSWQGLREEKVQLQEYNLEKLEFDFDGKTVKFEFISLKTDLLDYTFWLGKYEVTQGQYTAIMKGNPSDFTVSFAGEYKIKDSPNQPVNSVRTGYIEVFLNKVNEALAGKIPAGYRVALPTDLQWSEAAGVSSPKISEENSWLRSNSDNQTHEVGKLKKTGPGFYDLFGNVSEICRQRPLPQGPYVVRGGNFSCTANEAKLLSSPTAKLSSFYGERITVGFRLAIVPE